MTKRKNKTKKLGWGSHLLAGVVGGGLFALLYLVLKIGPVWSIALGVLVYLFALGQVYSMMVGKRFKTQKTGDKKLDSTLEEAHETAERIWNVIRAFSVREGSRRKDDTLPKRFLSEPIPDGPSQGMVMTEEVLEQMKDEYYEIRHWDRKTGIPLPAHLLKLGLPDIAEDMRTILSTENGV